MKTIGSIGELLSLPSDLTMFILSSCPWFVCGAEPIGSCKLQNDSTVCPYSTPTHQNSHGECCQGNWSGSHRRIKRSSYVLDIFSGNRDEHIAYQTWSLVGNGRRPVNGLEGFASSDCAARRAAFVAMVQSVISVSYMKGEQNAYSEIRVLSLTVGSIHNILPYRPQG